MLDGPRYGAKIGEAKQLVVLCHGVGADGQDLIDLGASWRQALPHAAFVAPDGPAPCDMAPYGRQWFSIGDREPGRILREVMASAQLLEAFVVAEAARLGLSAGDVALMGFSQGAMMVLHTGLRMAPPPRGIMAYSGRLIGAAVPTTADVLLVHGEADPVVPVAGSRDAEAALRQAGVAVQAQYSPRLQHGIDEAGIVAGGLFLQRVFSK